MGKSYAHLGLKGASLQVALVALVVAPSFILLGYNQAVLGGGIFSLSSWVETFPALDTIHKTGAELSYNSTIEGTCNASFQMGSFFGALSLSLYGEKLGRRKTVFIAAISSIVGQALQCSSTTLVQFVIGRVILGFSVGQLSGTVPVWQSECSSAKHRGQHVICDGIFICAGYVLCNWIDVAFSNIPSSTIQWRIPLMIPIAFSFVLAFSVFALPESPRWLVSKGQLNKATSSLAQYRGKVSTDPIVGQEIDEIKHSFENAEGAGLRDIFRKDVKSRLQFRFWLCLGLNFFLQACGGNLISSYSSTIFQEYLKFDSSEARILAACALTWKLMCCFIPFWIIDRIGRRACFMISGAGMAVCMAVLAITSSFKRITPAVAIVYILFVFLFNTFYPIGFLGGNFLYTTEVAPIRLRAAISSLATANFWLWNLVVVLVTPVAINGIGFWYYAIYAIISTSIPVCVYMFYPETMHRSLETIDKVFVDAPSIWKIVSMARNLPRDDTSGLDEVISEKREEAMAYVEMREHI